MSDFNHRLRHAVLQFKHDPTPETFLELHRLFEVPVKLLQKYFPRAGEWETNVLIGYMFCQVGKYKKGTPFNFFMKKLLTYCHELYQLEKDE